MISIIYTLERGREYSIITLSQNDQNLGTPFPLVRICSIFVTPSLPTNVQNFISTPFTTLTPRKIASFLIRDYIVL